MKYLQLLLAGVLGCAAVPALAAANTLFCGELANTFGPFDFRDSANAANLQLVETAHFTSNVERGEHGNSGTLGQELFYTLRAFPNHPRALATMSKVALRDNLVQIPDMRYPVECYFDRALRFTPDDPQVRAMFGQYLFARGQSERALGFLAQAAKLDPASGPVQYNLGIAYFKMKRYADANLAAQRAYALQFPLPGLRRMLTEAGQWHPEAAPAAAAGAADTAPATTAAPPASGPAVPGNQASPPAATDAGRQP